MEDGKILGRDDFAEKYAQENEDAFMVELPPEPIYEPEPDPEPVPVDLPLFVNSTPGPEPQDEEFDFGFQGVRAH